MEDLVPAWEFIAEWGRGSGLLITVFGCRVRVPEHGIAFDPYEVNDVKVVPYHVFRGKMMDHNDDRFAQELDRLEQSL